jgi:hypothetical protein
MAAPTLIFCADGNPHFAQIAIDCGFKYGAQLPNTIYFQPYFVDQNFKHPNFEAYADTIKRYKPYMASVLDWERREQLGEVFNWAETIAPFVEVVMVIPKVIGGIDKIPSFIGGKPMRLGYSVPTSFGGTEVPIWEFARRPVHLLGGSPRRQLELVKK